MQKQNKQKILLTTVTGLLLVLVSPAEANAPLMSQKAKEFHLAVQSPKKYAQIAIKAYNWDKNQYVCLSQLWGKESGWNYKADNPTSSAYGIAQMLGEKAKHPKKQIDNGLRYIEHRYGDPCNGWKWWKRHRWY
jgi:hypothetical protein